MRHPLPAALLLAALAPSLPGQGQHLHAAHPSAPPDPTSVAPALDRTVQTTMHDAVAFLFEGPDAIQVGMAPGTIAPHRTAVLRGRVLDAVGGPLPSVRISVLDHPEYGHTVTRADGAFDFALNGGGLVTLEYRRRNHLPVRRCVEVPWQDFVALPDVVMLALDPVVTPIDLSSPQPIQVAQGSVSTDPFGARQATLLFAAGTTATMTLPGGGQQALTNLAVRATEYTVGDMGPLAMPADLPSRSAYTYAVELTVDEAFEKGAEQVSFSQPVIHYAENFLQMPIGTPVPVGYYDREAAEWSAHENGVVLAILTINGGLAVLDVDGSGLPASAGQLAALGITADEQATLAGLYAPGDELWRVRVDHFSAWDMNFQGRIPDDAPKPPRKRPRKRWKKCFGIGSILGIQDQTLGEAVPVTGTPYDLRYQSDRVPGAGGRRSLRIPLTVSSVHADLKRVHLNVQVAGRSFAYTFPPVPDQEFEFTWDGLDAYGREVQGLWPCTVRVGHVYPLRYAPPVPSNPAWAQLSTVNGTIGVVGRALGERSVRYTEALGVWDARAAGLGGWNLDVHHAYEPTTQRLDLGTGEHRTAGEVDYRTVETLVPGIISNPQDVAVAANGDVYVADYGYSRVLRIVPPGSVFVVAGGGNPPDGLGDGLPATQAKILAPYDVELDELGRLYIVDEYSQRVRRVDLDGIIRTVAGSGPLGFTAGATLGDGGPATQARLNRPRGVSLDGEGGFYIATWQGKRVRHVDADGVIRTVAGNGNNHSGDGGYAVSAGITRPTGVVAKPGGGFWVIDQQTNRVRFVDENGIISTVAGNGTFGSGGDGGPGVLAQLADPFHATLEADGSLLVADMNSNKIRRLDTAGIINTVVGSGAQCGSPSNPCGDGGLAPTAQMHAPRGVAVAPDGKWYVVESGSHRLRRIGPVLPGFGVADKVIASEDGKRLFRFDGSGRHLETLDAFTGVALHTFAYDPMGRLDTVTDENGNATLVLRNGLGDPMAILAPFGQLTGLQLDANGYLSRIVHPSTDDHEFTYDSLGRMTAMLDPRGGPYAFTYDALGRLVRDDDPAGGFQTLAHAPLPNGQEVTLSSATGLPRVHLEETTASGALRRVVSHPDGAANESLVRTDGTTTQTFADGTVETSSAGADPRWGLGAPVPETESLSTPGGLTRTISVSRSVTLSNPSDPLSLITLTETETVNGKATTTTFDATADTRVVTSAAGRQHVEMLDALGRVVMRQTVGLEPRTYVYDAQGHVVSETSGTGGSARTTSFAYGTDGLLASVTDPLNGVTSFHRDAMGRVTREVLPDLAEAQFGWDASGNLASHQPPGRPAHAFAYTPVDLLASYLPPDVGQGPPGTAYAYDLDRRPTAITPPDGNVLAYTYGPGGSLTDEAHADATIAFTYDGPTPCCASSGRPVSIVRTPAGGGPVTLDFTYDGFLPLDDVLSGPVAGTYERTHDHDFQLATESVNGGFAVAYAYDPDGLVTQAGSLALTRDAQTGAVTATALGGLTTTHAYDSFGELVCTTASHGATLLFEESYAYDALGRVVQRVETVLGGPSDVHDYTYDARGRLVEAAKNGSPVATYTYDDNGNRLSRTDSGGTVAATYDDQDRLVQYGRTTYAWGANGELASKDAGGGAVTTYAYDHFGTLLSVGLPGGPQVDYTISAVNRRIGRSVGGALERGFLYRDFHRPVAELDAASAVVSRFVYAEPRVPAYMERGGATYLLVTDRLGSVRLVVDAATGAVAQRIDYDEFGVVLADSMPGFQPFGFAAGHHDQDTGLVRFGWRDYDPNTGRWTSKDPLRFGGGSHNLYGYAGNDPVNRVDELGLFDFKTCLGTAWDAIGGNRNSSWNSGSNCGCGIRG